MSVLDHTATDAAEFIHVTADQGWAVIEAGQDYQGLTDAAVNIGQLIGAATLGVRELEGNGSDNWLLRHTESITQDEGNLLGYFALGCLRKAESGGDTVIYDGRVAAKIVTEQFPEIANVRTLYTSTVYPGQMAVHPLVVDSPTFGPVLRYRGKATTNQIIDGLPNGMQETEYYRRVEQALDASVATEHAWREGELLVVNNQCTLHSRAPYVGHRRMLRFRYDDPNYQTIEVK